MAQQAQVTEEQARALAEESRESGWDKPSFAKELFLGRFPLELIHPFPRPSDAEEARTNAFLGKLREFLETVDGSVIERADQIPDEYVKGLAELGCFGLKIPSEYGGLNMSQVAYNRVLMMVTTVHSSLGALLSAHQSIGVPEPLKLAGTPEQKRKFLPRCAAGAISAFLLTEPDVGSDPARMASTATPIDDGQAYELEGVKLWTTNGVVAELLVVMARVPRSDGHRGGISAFVVEADSPGITVERRNKFMGLRGLENGRDPDAPRPGAQRKPDRAGGRRSEDRADHAQRRTAVFARGSKRGHQAVAENSAGMVRRAGAVGQAGWQT